jgi:hypothetical protein
MNNSEKLKCEMQAPRFQQNHKPFRFLYPKKTLLPLEAPEIYSRKTVVVKENIQVLIAFNTSKVYRNPDSSGIPGDFSVMIYLKK